MKTQFPFFPANMAAPRPVTTNAANVAFQAISYYKTCTQSKTQSDTDSDDHEGGMTYTREPIGSLPIPENLYVLCLYPCPWLPFHYGGTKSLTQQVRFLGCWLCDIDNEGKMKYESQQFFSMLHVCCRPTMA